MLTDELLLNTTQVWVYTHHYRWYFCRVRFALLHKSLSCTLPLCTQARVNLKQRYFPCWRNMAEPRGKPERALIMLPWALRSRTGSKPADTASFWCKGCFLLEKWCTRCTRVDRRKTIYWNFSQQLIWLLMTSMKRSLLNCVRGLKRVLKAYLQSYQQPPPLSCYFQWEASQSEIMRCDF